MTMSPEKFPSKKPDQINLVSSVNNFGFEFSLVDPVNMLSADELFSNGKLMPFHLSATKDFVAERQNDVFLKDPSMFSPRAPKCSSRWKELLGLKRLNQREKENRKTSSTTTTTSAAKSIKSLFNRSLKPSMLDSSLNLPLLKEEDTETDSGVSVSSSRMSLSSSSSSHDHDDLPRVSLDGSFTLPRLSVSRKHSSSTNQIRKQGEGSAPRVSVDSPRMNSSGKIVFSLERSTSTPNSLTGGSRYKSRGIERSYSSNVRITSVPVCSLRRGSKSGLVFGFPLFSSSQQSSISKSRVHQQHKPYQQKKNSNSKKIEKLTE